jgi:hypothetical protein
LLWGAAGLSAGAGVLDGGAFLYFKAEHPVVKTSETNTIIPNDIHLAVVDLTVIYISFKPLVTSA